MKDNSSGPLSRALARFREGPKAYLRHIALSSCFKYLKHTGTSSYMYRESYSRIVAPCGAHNKMMTGACQASYCKTAESVILVRR